MPSQHFFLLLKSVSFSSSHTNIYFNDVLGTKNVLVIVLMDDIALLFLTNAQMWSYDVTADE